MKVPITIEKSSKEDCPYDCPFRRSGYCKLFDERLKDNGYYDSHDYEACEQCQNLYPEELTNDA